MFIEEELNEIQSMIPEFILALKIVTKDYVSASFTITLLEKEEVSYSLSINGYKV